MTRKLKSKIALLSLPALGGFLAFYIVPFFCSIGYSFINNVAKKEFVWFANYKEVFSNKYFCLALKNTVIFSGVGVLVSPPLSS